MVDVLCESGKIYPLAKTYVRTEELEYANRFLRENEFFPWLSRETPPSDKCGLLDLEVMAKALGFGYPQSDLEFHLTILQYIMMANSDVDELADCGRVYDLYRRIEARYQESLTPGISRKIIRYVPLIQYWCGDFSPCL